jgi:hypothetical protein
MRVEAAISLLGPPVRIVEDIIEPLCPIRLTSVCKITGSESRHVFFSLPVMRHGLSSVS